MSNIYVGNCSFDVTEEQLRDLFAAYGEVDKVNVITDRDTGEGIQGVGGHQGALLAGALVSRLLNQVAERGEQPVWTLALAHKSIGSGRQRGGLRFRTPTENHHSGYGVESTESKEEGCRWPAGQLPVEQHQVRLELSSLNDKAVKVSALSYRQERRLLFEQRAQ